jgi:hypothetical protein
LREKAQIKASRAAEGQGAGQEAAGSASQCAATVAFTNETLKVVRGHMRFKAPAKEMHWKDRDEVQLAVAPKTWVPIEELKQEVDQAQGAGVECIKLGDKMEAYFIPDDHFDITPHDAREQDVELEKSTTWTWDIVASEKGEHLLDLNVTAHVYSPSERDMYRSIQQDPPLFDDYINVSATTPEVFTAFVADRWPVLVPLLLTILTAIIIPFVVPWWKRRNQPSEPVDRSSAYRDDGWM